MESGYSHSGWRSMIVGAVLLAVPVGLFVAVRQEWLALEWAFGVAAGALVVAAVYNKLRDGVIAFFNDLLGVLGIRKPEPPPQSISDAEDRDLKHLQAMVGANKTELPPSRTVKAILSSDGPLNDPKLASTALLSLRDRMSRFIRNRSTVPPFTFALTGDWGSGKSSAMRLLQKDLRARRYPTVWFNAWHHQSEDHLFAALMEQIRLEAVPGLFTWRFYHPSNLMIRLRLLMQRVDSNPIRYIAEVFLIILAFGMLGALALSADVVPVADSANRASEQQWDSSLRDLAIPAGVAASLLAGLTAVWDVFKPFKVRPATLMKTMDGWFRTGRFEEKLGFRHHFGNAFAEVCKAFGPRRLTILIDDLDRCKPGKVVDVLEAVNFLVTSGDCFVVMGVSETPVRDAVGLRFNEIAEERALARAVKEEKETELTDQNKYEARTEYAKQYLEKLFNLRVPIPALDAEALKNVLDPPKGVAKENTHTRWVRQGRAVALVLSAVVVGGLSTYALYGWVMADPGSEKKIESPVIEDIVEFPGLFLKVRPTEPEDLTIAAMPTRVDKTQRSLPSSAPDEPIETSLLPLASAVPSETPLVTWHHPLAWGLAIFAITATVLLYFRWRLDREDEPDADILEDHRDFRTALELILPMFLSSNSSPRAVKRFTNRMRYLTGDRDEEKEPGTLGNIMVLGACDEFGALEMETLDDWRNYMTVSKFDENSAAMSVLEFDPERITQEDWETYRRLAASVHFSGVEGAAALEGYRASLEIAQRLVQTDPMNTDWRRNLSVSYDRFGDGLRLRGNYAGALKNFREGLEIAQRLTETDPSNTDWQRDLSVSHNKIGDVLVAQGDGAGALESYRAGLEIRQRLAETDPLNAEWRRDVAISYAKLADFEESGFTWADVARAFQAMQDDGVLNPVDLPLLQEAKRRAVAD